MSCVRKRDDHLLGAGYFWGSGVVSVFSFFSNVGNDFTSLLACWLPVSRVERVLGRDLTLVASLPIHRMNGGFVDSLDEQMSRRVNHLPGITPSLTKWI